MRIVFWQNCLSQHQLPYIVELVNSQLVTEVVIVASPLSETRKELGWDVDFPDLNKCVVLISPNKNLIRNILRKNESESIHLFSGLNDYPQVYLQFKMSLNYDVKRGIISERPSTYGLGVDWFKPLWLYRIRFWFYNRKYVDKIDYVFEIGESSVHYFKSISSSWKVFPFAYCTRENYEITPKAKNGSLQVCYVGALSKRKNVMLLLRAAKVLNESGYKGRYELNLIGAGPEEKILKNFVGKHKLCNVHFLGMIPNKKLPTFLVSQDVLVLPSIHDGWGAVINEALQAGLYTICSDRCGAKEMISNAYLGNVFDMGNYLQLVSIIGKTIDRIQDIRSSQEKRRQWARASISGVVISNYMVDCLSKINPVEPWLKQVD